MPSRRRVLSVGLCGVVAVVGSLTACSQEDTADGASGSALNDAEDLFAKSTALDLSISAPTSTLFARLRAKQPDPAEADAGPNAEPEFSEAAKITLRTSAGTKEFDARIYVRGESSRYDCAFPKLKIAFSNKEQLKGTIFKGHSKIRLNTHCGPGDENTLSGYGRIKNGVGPVREDLVYRLIRAADVPTYMTRIAKITYEDTVDKSSLDTFGVLVESGDDAAQRLVKAGVLDADAKYLDPSEVWGHETPENRSMIVVAEALSGNTDFKAAGTHNVDSFGTPDVENKPVFKIPQDFDLCTIVTPTSKSRFGPVDRASAGLATPAVADHFAKRKAAIEQALDLAEQEYLAANAMKTEDGKTTTDLGFKTARERVAQLYALPELAGRP